MNLYLSISESDMEDIFEAQILNVFHISPSNVVMFIASPVEFF